MSRLFLLGLVTLFLELACIRWIGSTVIFIQFFSNLVLVAAFLGLSLGCLAAESQSRWLARSPRLLMYGVAGTIFFALAYESWTGLTIDVAGTTPNEPVFFGSEERDIDAARFVVPLEIMAGAFFLWVAFLFVGLGQELGQSMNATAERLKAYSANVFGSLAGIALFSWMSWARMPAAAWFAVSVALIGYLLHSRGELRADRSIFLLASLLMVWVTGRSGSEDVDVFWSPYYRVSHVKPLSAINVNAMPHQVMLPLREATPVSSLPHLLNRDAGKGPLERVLVIGAGSGNDVSAAFLNGSTRVDAVEIDPIIKEIGERHHPDRPYDDPRVTTHIQDGRRFLRTAPAGHYDLVVYALVDSVVLQSSFSSLRLESFLFTAEAFADVRRVMKPEGLFALYNVYRRDWVVQRIVDMLEGAFGRPPLVLNIPLGEPESAQLGFVSMLAGATDAIEESFRRSGAYRISRRLGDHISRNDWSGFDDRPHGSLDEDLLTLKPVTDPDPAFEGEPASDDWPFLYLYDRGIAIRPYLSGALVIAALSILLITRFSSARIELRPRMFFLGAAFMLLETKAVVQLGLLFGSTWTVSSSVFFAVLLLVLCANLLVIRAPSIRVPILYGLLALAIALNYWIEPGELLSGGDLSTYFLPALLVLAPIFFASAIFARAFAESRSPAADLAANIAGSIFGALSEALSMLLGFSGLLAVAGLYYALSAIDARGTREA